MHFQSDFTWPEEKIVTFKKESEYIHIFLNCLRRKHNILIESSLKIVWQEV